MLVTGFMGSPRKKGNTSFLLQRFLSELENLGAETRSVHVPDLTIRPCIGCGLCERKGFCHFDDDMRSTVLPLIRNSQVLVMASPIYFYTVPAEMKALIDRTQTLWSRKFKLGLVDPDEQSRKGFLLSVGATRGNDLFDSIHLTMKYFFRGISTDYAGSLTYWQIEEPGDMKKHPTVEEDIRSAAEDLMAGFLEKPSWLFLSHSDDLAGPMARALCQTLGQGRVQAHSAGLQPARETHPLLVPYMAEQGLDLDYRIPGSIESAVRTIRPEKVIVIGCLASPAAFPESDILHWDIPCPDDPSSQDMKAMETLIRNKLNTLFLQI